MAHPTSSFFLFFQLFLRKTQRIKTTTTTKNPHCKSSDQKTFNENYVKSKRLEMRRKCFYVLQVSLRFFFFYISSPKIECLLIAASLMLEDLTVILMRGGI